MTGCDHGGSDQIRRTSVTAANRAVIIDAGGDVTADLGDRYEADALVEWASVTKTVTAAAVLVLLAERDIPRDTPARDLLPDVPDDATYTVDDLIRHRSGLPRVHQGMSAGIVGDPYADVSEADVTRALRQTPTTPGERDYSNLGYAVLGRLLEHVTQEAWSTVAERTVLAPLGITSATLDPAPERRTLLRSWRGRPREPWTVGSGPYAPAAGIWSTMSDLLRFGVGIGRIEPDFLAWEHRDGLIWHSGQTRDAGVCLLRHGDVTIASHALGAAPGAADRLAVRRLRAVGVVA